MQTMQQALPAESVDLVSTQELKSAWLRAEPVEFGDPVLAHTSLPFHETYFPLGFPLTIATNSTDVLDAAAQSWGTFSKLFDTEPIRMQIGVTTSSSSECPPPPACRVRDHLTTNIADGENFAICDHAQGYSLVWVTTATLQHRDYFRYFFLDSSAMCCIAARYATGIHAGCVALGGAGLLLCGDSGAGKSTLSYACARAGFTYVSDDGSYLVHNRDDRLVVGNSSQVRFRPSARNLFPELRSCTVMRRAGFGKPSVEMATGVHPSLETSNTAVIRHIVFLNRNVQNQELAVFPTGAARLYMLQRVHCMPYLGSLHTQAIDRLLQVDAFELRYNQLDWAVERLELLAREGK